MTKLSLKSLFLIISIIGIGCEGKYISDQEAVDINEVKAVNSPTRATGVPIDTAKSIILWKGTKMRGNGKHEGTLKFIEGELLYNDDQLVGGHFIADMNSVAISDMPAHERVAIRNLTNHLKSEFNTIEYPYSRFEITKVQYLEGSNIQLSGNLTIKYVTKSISIPVVAHFSDEKIKQFMTKFKFDRFAWNIGIDGSWLEKRLVDKDIELNIVIVPKEVIF